MSNDRIDRFVWQEGEVELYDKDGNRLDLKTMSNNQALIDLSGFVDVELIDLFKKVAAKEGTTLEAVLSDFMKDYIVSGGHPEQVVNRWPWNKQE